MELLGPRLLAPQMELQNAAVATLVTLALLARQTLAIA
jgi:hypothetical protein